MPLNRDNTMLSQAWRGGVASLWSLVDSATADLRGSFGVPLECGSLLPLWIKPACWLDPGIDDQFVHCGFSGKQSRQAA